MRNTELENVGIFPDASDPRAKAIAKSSTTRVVIDDFEFRGNLTASGGSPLILNFADNEIPAGTINGVNADFTLAHTPSPASSLDLFVDGVKAAANEFTLTGAAVHFVSALPTTSLVAKYR